MAKKEGCGRMPLISGCQEGKGTPRLVEVKCPRCVYYSVRKKVVL